MIYFFTGDSGYLVREKTLDWKNQYIKKYGDFNMIHFKDLSEVDDNILNQELLAEGFMGEKKLILIDNFPLGTNQGNSSLTVKQDLLLTYLDKIPENNIILFSSVNPDKRSKLYKKLKKIAEIKDFNKGNDNDLYSFINSKFNGKINNQAIKLLIRYKAGNLEKIISEISKLLILNNFIDDEIIKVNIMPELEESIFQVVDNIMNLNIIDAISKINIILTQTNVYAFYNNLLANLRVLVFIQKLKSLKVSNISEILDLKNRSFLANKNYKISTTYLEQLYIGLVNLDKKMKSGKMIASEDEVLKYEIEKEILKLNMFQGD